MKKTDILRIEKMIQTADYENTSESYSNVYKELEKLDGKYPSNSLLYYYKGLACYLNPDVEEFRTKWAIKHFEKALKLDSKHTMSKIYLGHCHFDLGEFIKAQNDFKEVLSNKSTWTTFLKEGQMWRLVNLAELVAVCNLKLGRIQKYQFYYMPWKELYYLHIRSDNFYFPERLIIETASYLKVKGDSMSDENIAFFRKASLDLIGIIKGGDGFEEIYSEELKNLKNWNGHQQYQPVRAYSH